MLSADAVKASIPKKLSTKTYIANVTEAILSEHSFDSISTALIIEAAQVSKTTFYRYFKDKYDVVSWIYMSKIEDAFERPLTFEEITRLIYNIMYTNKKFYIDMLGKDTQNSLSDFLYHRSKNDLMEIVKMQLNTKVIPSELYYLILFYCAGMKKTWETWSAKRMQESPEFIADLILGQMPNELKPYIDNYRLNQLSVGEDDR